MGQLLEELRRRNVFRVTVAYVIVTWLVIQVIETVSEPLGLPDWTEAFFIVLMLAGLPVVVLFAWVFELTPEGLKKTEDVDTEESVTNVTGKKLNYTIIVVLAMALGYFLWERQGLVEQAGQTAATPEQTAEVTETTGETSIAVLPFVNMSNDPDQEYFSDGISEELLNLLAKIPDLRVPARTSSFQFKGQNLDISEVAEKLNVKHVLEGSVRKADVRVRVTAQLIEVETGYHLWSDTYDRELDDIFAIQDEISAAIVTALSDTLGLEVDAAPQVKGAANPEAYNAFLLAQHQIKKRTKTDLESAIPNYERALELDPNYAPAHAGIALAWHLLTASNATYGTLTLKESLANAMPHIEKALRLDGELPEAFGVMGLLLNAQERYEEAVPYYEKALALNPSLTDVRNWYSQALADLGQQEASLAQMEKAYEMDPLSVLTLHNYTNELMMRRRFDAVEPVLDRLTQIDPARGAMFKGYLYIVQGRAAEGVEQPLRAIELDADNLNIRNQAAWGLWTLGYKEAGLSVWPFPDNVYDLVSNGTDFEYILELAQNNFNRDPDNPTTVENLAWAHWDVGNREEALTLAAQYLDSLGETRRPIDGANMLFAFDARNRGDEETALARIGPVEASIDQQIASGVDFFWVHVMKAIILDIRGNRLLALDHLEKATTRSIMPIERLAYFYKVMGWDDDADFAALQDRHRNYILAESSKLLEVACGPDGFEAWQPSAAECGKGPGPN
jgi:TolB-like protein/lipoprotein NlpI